MTIRKAGLIAAVVGAAALMSGCVYEQPAYPSYAQAYPGYYGEPYYYGPTVGVGVGFGDGWHDHDDWHHGWHHWR